ncbi:MAG: hypothetical protein COB67_02105 [SAR324 cluster bacterium]|uniref:Glutamyl-tRNA(Gln) amidotransferase subunit C n=1 Tax=SAR324 cluster bacterium TaxID=2024889 RepID=A0A2A4T9J6_9DELT|nr:MAG: hypothetical protein COB67_02105 [SAR324 cluster bacterium]
MTAEIDVQKVAKLAHLKLDAQEEKYFQDKFKGILGYVGMIEAVEIGEDTLEKDESLQKVYYQDQQRVSPVSPEQFSDYMENKFIKVPKIIE